MKPTLFFHVRRIFQPVVFLGLFVSYAGVPIIHAEYVIEKTLHEFFPANSQPAHPAAQLIQGQDGAFYGTTRTGGIDLSGTVFRLTPSGGLIVLASFGGTNGANPSGGLVQNSDGVLYGTTSYGTNPPFDSGAIFEITTNGVLTKLFYFSGTNGSNPSGPLASRADVFYGTTRNGGSNGFGTVFKYSPNELQPFKLLHSFDGTNDGCYPSAGVTSASDGNFYGMTPFGGNGFTDFSGNGTVFRIGTNGNFTSLVSFDSNYVGSFKSRFTLGTDGQLYGVAGKQIFRMTTNGVLTPLAAFNGTNGIRSSGGVTEGKDGNFYGITSYHTDGENLGYGTIYKMTTNGELSTIFYFNGTFAANPFGTFVLASDGNLYAAVADEQANLTLNGNAGSIFRLVEPPNLSANILGNNMVLTWTTFTGGNYRLEKKYSLDSTDWMPVGLDFTAGGSSISYANLTVEGTQEFYRTVLLP